jgi:hypothetical protein
MTHPSETSLALHAGGDLGVWARWRISHHAIHCEECRTRIDAFRSAHQQLRDEMAELPPEVNWGRLAGEMKANIHLGLVAGECVAEPLAGRLGASGAEALLGYERQHGQSRVTGERQPEPRPLFGRLTAVAAPALLLVLVGLLLQHPQPRSAAAPWVDGTLIEANRGGIEMRQGDRMMSLRHPEAEDVTNLVNVEGGLRASYVDSQTGQITIQNLYAQ